jgi:acetyl-CoA carboxylase biotin carboxyl carrier protein
MQLPLDQLKSLLKTLDEGGASEFEYEDEQIRIRVALPRGQAPIVTGAMLAPSAAHAPVAAPAATASSPRASEDASVVFITSPFVGTFYRAPSPEAEDFASVGATVKKGQTLCIVEAMKLMNEIESEYSGTVLEILVENGKSVEFGQKLFKIKKG